MYKLKTTDTIREELHETLLAASDSINILTKIIYLNDVLLSDEEREDIVRIISLNTKIAELALLTKP